MPKQAYPAHPEVPISKAVRAGDFVFTSAYGPWTFDPPRWCSTRGPHSRRRNRDAAACRSTSRYISPSAIREALAVAGCTLADVVDCQVWLADAAISSASTRSTAPISGSAGAFGLPIGFMFDCKVEMKVIAYRPLGKA